MADPATLLADRVRAALAQLGPDAADADPSVRPSKVADFQVNAAFELAKSLKRNPREVAAELMDALQIDDLCSGVEVAGPGYINLTLADSFVAEGLVAAMADPHLGVSRPQQVERVVVDYSAPNVAKEMHVGHLRSTVIGDALTRILGSLGHTIVRQNHVGDWGTPFGMLIEHLIDIGEDEAANELSIGDLNGFYQQARTKFDGEEGFADRARTRVVLMQAGDPQTLRLWQLLVDESARYFSTVYDGLGVLLEPGDYAGESVYNDALAPVVDELAQKGLLVTDDGAECVFPPGFVGRDGDPQPVIVRKSDGGFGYSATDLAAIRRRLVDMEATWVLYVVGAPQATHLQMIFAIAEMAGWLVPPARCEHVAFGSVLGDDGKIFRTRAGATVKLADLLTEATERAAAVVAEKSASLPADEQAAVAVSLGIGAVKYADLSIDRIKDYTFDWDRMLALTGNTAGYLQMANARIRSILRRAAEAGDDVTSPIEAPTLAEPEERALALALLGYDAAVHAAADRLAPHRLCTYLFDLAQTYTDFYESCPVLASEGDTRATRLALCRATTAILGDGLGLLGIDAPERL